MKYLLISIGILAVPLFGQGEQQQDQPAPPDYVLASNDQIILRTILVKEIGDKPFRLDEQGEINLPMVGRLHAAGLTARQLEAELNKKYAEFYVEPQIGVSISEYRGAPVSIIGAVGSPGVHQVRGKPLLLEVLSSAGGIRSDAGPMIKITRQKKYGPIPLALTQESNGDSVVAQVGVQSLVEARNPAENIAIQPYDVITIPRADVIYVVGNVKKAGSFDLNGRRSLSVVEALSLAGGFDLRAASKNARILRAPPVGKTVVAQNQKMIGNRQEIMVDLTKVLGGKAEDLHMQPNDILYVPNSMAKTVTSRSIEVAIQVGVGFLIWR